MVSRTDRLRTDTMYLQYSFLLEIKVFRRKIGRESVGVIYLSPPVVDGPG